MVVAILTVHRGNGFFAFNNGAELPIVYVTGAVSVAFAGAGRYSIDHLLGFDSSIPEFAVGMILACGILAGLGARVFIRRLKSSSCPVTPTTCCPTSRFWIQNTSFFRNLSGWRRWGSASGRP